MTEKQRPAAVVAFQRLIDGEVNASSVSAVATRYGEGRVDIRKDVRRWRSDKLQELPMKHLSLIAQLHRMTLPAFLDFLERGDAALREQENMSQARFIAEHARRESAPGKLEAVAALVLGEKPKPWGEGTKAIPSPVLGEWRFQVTAAHR